MDTDLLRTLRHAVMFDRTAAIALRHIADSELELDLAQSLQHIADRLEADAAAMDRHLPEGDPMRSTAADQSHFSAAAD